MKRFKKFLTEEQKRLHAKDCKIGDIIQAISHGEISYFKIKAIPNTDEYGNYVYVADVDNKSNIPVNLDNTEFTFNKVDNFNKQAKAIVLKTIASICLENKTIGVYDLYLLQIHLENLRNGDKII